MRTTAPAASRIRRLDWLDDHTLLFDRLEPKDKIGYQSSLRRLSLRE